MPFDIQLDTRTPSGLGATVVIAHPLPPAPPLVDGLHCFVFTATGGGAYLQMNLGSGYDYPLTPHGSGFYHNLSTVAVSYGYEHLNYTLDGKVFGYVRVDLYGHNVGLKSVTGSVAWAVDARCQAAAAVQQRMAMGIRGEAVRSGRTVEE